MRKTNQKPKAPPVRVQPVVSRRGKLLCSVWTHPDSGQMLVIPGRLRETRKIARGHMCCYDSSPRKLKGYEELWSDRKLKALPEYDG